MKTTTALEAVRLARAVARLMLNNAPYVDEIVAAAVCDVLNDSRYDLKIAIPQDDRLALLNRVFARISKLLDIDGWTDDQSRVGALLSALPYPQRGAVVLVDAAGFSIEEAAAICAVRLKTLSANLEAGRARLRAEREVRRIIRTGIGPHGKAAYVN